MDTLKTCFIANAGMRGRVTVFVLALCMLLMPDLVGATEADPCVYDLHLTGERVKIICQGPPFTVNIHANSALLQTEITGRNSREPERHLGVTSSTVGTQPPPDFLSWNSSSGSWQPGTVSNEMPDPRSEFDPSERLTLSEYHVSEESLAEPDLARLEETWEKMLAKKGSSFVQVVRDSSQKLDKARQNLSACTESIRNISAQLVEGGFDFKPHMENLRTTGNSATDLKEGIIAAMRSQYHSMSIALLTRNHELEKIVASMSALMDIVTEAFQSALAAHNTIGNKVNKFNSTLVTMRKRVAREITRYDSLKARKGINTGMKESCPKQISAIGTGSFKRVQWTNGSYMVDPAAHGLRRPVYIMAGSGPNDQLMEYSTALDVDYELLGRYLRLPFLCAGAGHAVYRSHFYCHKLGTRLIVKYHLKRLITVSELAIPRAIHGNMESGAKTHIDLAVDELGLWAIYSTEDSGGNITITKIDSKKMEIQKTWLTNHAFQQSGNSFMICGVLYVTNSHSEAPTFVRYMYDTETNTELVLDDGVLPFVNSALLGINDRKEMGIWERPANSVMLAYDFKTAMLYSWKSGRIEFFPIYFDAGKKNN